MTPEAGLLFRMHWQRHIATPDPENDYDQICRTLLTHEFLWDFVRSLSPARSARTPFRRLAVCSTRPEILDERLLAASGYRVTPAQPDVGRRAFADIPRIRSYPAGDEVGDLGTFPRGCSVVHTG